MSEKSNEKHNSHSSKSIKPYKVRAYFTTPVIFAIVLLIIALPIEIVLKNEVNDHIIEGYKSSTERSFYDDVSIDRKLPLSSNETNDTTYSPIAKNEGYGKIICENAGLITEVYRGADCMANLRNGVGSVDAIPGGDNSVFVYGYSTNHFKKLGNIKVNDEVIFNTTYAKYRYKVREIKVANDFDFALVENQNLLVMYCTNGSNMFDNNKTEKLYVIADLISGPKAVEDVK